MDSPNDAPIAPDNTGVGDVQNQKPLNPPTDAASPADAKPEVAPTPEADADAPLTDVWDENKPKPEDEGAPEQYEAFSLPEGFVLEGETQTEVTNMFKGMGLSQANAQKLVDYFVKANTDNKARELDALDSQRKVWRTQIRQRQGYEAERAAYDKAIRKFVVTPEEKSLFDSWMRDHPAIWDIFVRVGKSVSEDSPIPKGGGDNTPTNINLTRFPL